MARDNWGTPDWIVDLVYDFFAGYEYTDPCGDPLNPGRTAADIVYTLPENDGLKLPWGDYAFINPPYSKILPWVRWYATQYQARGEPILALWLVPVDPSTRWWAELSTFYPTAAFFRKRVRFEGAQGSPPFASAMLMTGHYGSDIPNFRRVFGDVAAIWECEEICLSTGVAIPKPGPL